MSLQGIEHPVRRRDIRGQSARMSNHKDVAPYQNDMPEQSEKTVGQIQQDLRNLQSKITVLQEMFATDNATIARLEKILSATVQLETKLKLAKDKTLALLIGGTGSGKSSLFNCLTETQTAKVGAIRPTSVKPTAAFWCDERLSEREEAELRQLLMIDCHDLVTIKADNQLVELDNIVLVDVPDHDSVRVDNARYVANLAPIADLLIWVVDPQKYADPGSYIQKLEQRKQAAVVVINHTDLLSRQEIKSLHNHLRIILDNHQLEQVPIIHTSALYGQGVSALWQEIVMANRDNQTKACVQEELTELNGQVQTIIGAEVTLEIKQYVHECTVSIANVCGLKAVEESLRRVEEKRRGVTAKIEVVSPTVMRAERDVFVDKVASRLPLGWKDILEKAPAGVDKTRRDIARVLESSELVTPQSHKLTKAGIIWRALLVFLLAALVTGVAVFIKAMPGLGIINSSTFGDISHSHIGDKFWGQLAVEGAILFFVLLIFIARLLYVIKCFMRRDDTNQYRHKVESAIFAVLWQNWGQPVEKIIERRKDLIK